MNLLTALEYYGYSLLVITFIVDPLDPRRGDSMIPSYIHHWNITKFITGNYPIELVEMDNFHLPIEQQLDVFLQQYYDDRYERLNMRFNKYTLAIKVSNADVADAYTHYISKLNDECPNLVIVVLEEYENTLEMIKRYTSNTLLIHIPYPEYSTTIIEAKKYTKKLVQTLFKKLDMWLLARNQV